MTISRKSFPRKEAPFWGMGRVGGIERVIEPHLQGLHSSTKVTVD